MSFRSVLALVAVCVVSCGSPPPSAVDEEVMLVDLAACVRGDSVCERSGIVGSDKFLVDADHGVTLVAQFICGNQGCDLATQDCCAANPTQCVPKGSCGPGAALVPPRPASISLPIKKPSADARLAWIAMGVASSPEPHELRVTLEGNESIIAPTQGWARVELDGHNAMPAAGARLELKATAGAFSFIWVVGRWKR